jgi:hypothetical protein
MPQDRYNRIPVILASVTLVMLYILGPDQAYAANNTPDYTNDPPPRCAGYGALQSISLTDWETGRGSWTVGTHDVADPNTFDTPDWAVVGSLPDSRAGMAAFVANLDIGDCGADDQTGALRWTTVRRS